MKQFKRPGSVMNKKMPTLLGLLVLVGALVSGLVFFGEGTGVFAPRATPQITPKKVRVTNVTDTTFTVSFYTDEETVAFAKYGTVADKLDSQASDDRDQLSGDVGEYHLHHITVRGLNPDTNYHYVLGTGSQAEFDNEGEPFIVTTAQQPSSPVPDANTIYGSIATAGGTPAEGSIVYVTNELIGPMSSLVQSSGSWAVPLSKAMNKAATDYVVLSADEKIQLTIQGESLNEVITHQFVIAEAQPVAELSFGKLSQVTEANNQATATDSGSIGTNEQATESAQNLGNSPAEAPQTSVVDSPSSANIESSISGRLTELLDQAEEGKVDSSASAILNISQTASNSGKLVTNTKPKIKGQAAPNVKVQIQIHSDNQIEAEVTADAAGEFEIDLEALKETLDPGEHTVTYSYVDPETGDVVEVTESFVVEDPNAVKIAQVNTESEAAASSYQVSAESEDAITPTVTLTPTVSTSSTTVNSSENVPYGSGNPYPMTTPTIILSPTPSLISTPSATPTIVASRSAVVATESSMYESGSVTNTIALMIGGLFLMACGGWSWWLAKEMEE